MRSVQTEMRDARTAPDCRPDALNRAAAGWPEQIDSAGVNDGKTSESSDMDTHAKKGPRAHYDLHLLKPCGVTFHIGAYAAFACA